MKFFSFGHFECFLLDTLSVTHYSKLTVQYQKNVSNTVASSAVNVTYCTLEVPMTITVRLTFLQVGPHEEAAMAEYSLHGSTGGWH